MTVTKRERDDSTVYVDLTDEAETKRANMTHVATPRGVISVTKMVRFVIHGTTEDGGKYMGEMDVNVESPALTAVVDLLAGDLKQALSFRGTDPVGPVACLFGTDSSDKYKEITCEPDVYEDCEHAYGPRGFALASIIAGLYESRMPFICNGKNEQIIEAYALNEAHDLFTRHCKVYYRNEPMPDITTVRIDA